MEFARSRHAFATPGGVNDENDVAVTRKGGVGGKTGGLGGGGAPGGKAADARATAKTPGRAALGNITNGGPVGGGGASVRKPAVAREAPVVREAAPAAAPARTAAERWFEEERAKLSAAEQREIRELAERYVDEDDDVEYFHGRTREEQMKEMEAMNRAETEKRVRELLGRDGFRERLFPSVSEEFIDAGVRHLKLSERMNEDGFDLGGEDDLCNVLSPTRAWEDDDDDDDELLRPPPIDEVLASIDDDLF